MIQEDFQKKYSQMLKIVKFEEEKVTTTSAVQSDISNITSLKQVNIHKVLNKGAFGTVSLMSLTEDGPQYAIKAIDKAQMIK